MAKAVIVTKMLEGQPDLNGLSYRGWSLCAYTPNKNWCIGIISGTGAQLTAIGALAWVTGVCVLTTNGGHWPQLDDVIDPAIRTKWNQWLTNNNMGLQIGENWTNGLAILTVCLVLNRYYGLGTTDVLE